MRLKRNFVSLVASISVVFGLFPAIASAQSEQEVISKGSLETENISPTDSLSSRYEAGDSHFLSPDLIPTVPSYEESTLQEELLHLGEDSVNTTPAIPQYDLGLAQSEKKPGQMRSDRFPLPNGITKEEADAAEILESQLQQSNHLRATTTSGCEVFWPSSYLVCGAIAPPKQKLPDKRV
ncbi:hypothetical protein [Corynebacterium callunae]|uniref:Secreted protein n=1 Tax=Corynebacterium callunae DSM 20147 TaxID=1121353 RepID=M1USS8_9CORY|nr:hypothetical protein [Corynebacterium callunae]AGG66207.1 hypothetical protein H924_03805 [Corynebacterium callunae DSM 20147]